MDHVRKSFERDGNSISVLEDISLDVRNGEFICLVGPSGCGKSTLLNVMGGFLSPTSGSVAIDGETVQGPDPRRILVFQERGVFPWLTVEGNIGFGLSKLSDAERTKMRRARIGFVFQRFNLLPTLSAMGNIEIAHDIANLGASAKKELDQPLLTHLTQLLGIEGRLDHRPNELSGGEQQRVAIARALITRPAIVLADEPTGNLDTKNSDAVLHMLRQSSRELNQTVLMITHNPEAAEIADRILHMRDGEITHIENGKG